jgi:hypothetical protein
VRGIAHRELSSYGVDVGVKRNLFCKNIKIGLVFVIHHDKYN